jgi:CheY-like chemotaxis protein
MLEPSPAGPFGAIMIRVRDTGAGMDAATLARAFEPYFTTKPPGQGSGLGLATVVAFVTQSGGHIEAASEIGQGSTFTIYLPCESAPTVSAAARAPVGAATVLVVEPEGGVRELIGEILDIHGYHVLSASDPEGALAVSREHDGPIALIVADLLAPGVAGDGLVQRLGRHLSGARVLYLSGDLEDSAQGHRGLRREVGFLRKPFTVDALIHRVHEMLA